MSHHNHSKESGRKLHKDWRVWLVVILMLGAMASYVLTLDETVWPRLFGH
ncbi:MAG: hypothetical protein Q7J98_08980 [Kiritimatiellia bacterium]|nr:hypothetical protein [Kiritimatiellia bacterium]